MNAKNAAQTGTPLGAVRLAAPRADRAAAVLARAFRDDPIQRYVTPDGDRRARLAPRTFGAVVRYCLLRGEVFTTPDLGGVACWVPPGGKTADLWGVCRSGMVLEPLRLGPAAFGRFMGVSAYMDAERRRVAPAPHWHLFVIGVEPSRQGEGIGGALLAPVLDRADAEGTPCCLETQTERNVRFYEKHGFSVASFGEPRGLPVWTMIRAPRPERAGTRDRKEKSTQEREGR